MKGRTPLPIAIHRAQGSFRADRHGGSPEPKAATPKAPKWLGKEAKALWRYFASRLAEVRVLTELDQQCLAVYVAAAARLAKAEAEIAKTGEVVKSPAGFAVTNPWVQIALKCTETMRHYGEQLGLSPAARTRIKINPNRPAAALSSRIRETG
ncbi:MAG: phage terminase small subunit P27 family [Isosphaeraceae bacterium]